MSGSSGGSGNDSSGGGSGSGGDSSSEGDFGAGDSSGSPSRVEQAVTVASVAFTLVLFAFLVWQAVQVPADASPRAHVADTEQLPGDRVGVTVVLTNPASEGLLSATVTVDCAEPPPTVEFTHVPTDGRADAVVVCPAGNASDATANVSVWQTA